MQNNFFGSKLNSVLLLILIILLGFVLRFMYQEKATYLPFMEGGGKMEKVENVDGLSNVKEVKKEEVKSTYTYTNHGFSIELPKGYIPKEYKGENSPTVQIELPNYPSNRLTYITDVTVWEKMYLFDFSYVKEERIGGTTFKIYTDLSGENKFYFFKQGKVGYTFYGDIKLLETFKFVGWPLDWKSAVYKKVSFKYPSDWNLEKIYEKSEGDSVRLQGPVSENQIITITNYNNIWNQDIYNVKVLNGVTFVIPKALSQDSQSIFLNIIDSVKYIN